MAAVAGKTRILLGEDDPDHQELLQDILTQDRPDVDLIVAADGEEIIRRIRDTVPGTFACVILDYGLPDCQAGQLLPRLADAGLRCPVLVISSSKSQDVVIECMRNGCTDFVPKEDAFSGDNLWNRVQQAIDRFRKAYRERRRDVRRAKHLASLAEHDPLTGLSNRRGLQRLFDGQRTIHDRRGRSSAIMLDIDHFKSINDKYGHPCGDLVLQAVAEVLRKHGDADDILCRYGGEEFLIIKPLTTIAQGFVWSETVRAAIESLRFTFNGTTISVTASLGVANHPSDNLSGTTISYADQAMYMAKSLGRNRVATWEMVEFDRLREWAEIDKNDSLDERLAKMLQINSGRLGPTQKDHLTTHSKRVSQIAQATGSVLGLDLQMLERLRVAGLCHDLGKFLVPEEILAKSEPLSSDEKVFLERHAAYGAEMAAVLGVEQPVVEMIREHHVRYDQRPKRDDLNDDNHALGSGILAVADALAAMTSDRSYQPARSISNAVQELRRESGKQFDPVVVKAVPAALSGQYTNPSTTNELQQA